MRTLLAFVAVAAVVTITPGPGTAMVIRSALRGGRGRAFRTIIGNEIGVMMWGLLSVLGISAVVAASRIAFDILRLVGALVLVIVGLQSLLRRGGEDAPAESAERPDRLRAGSGMVWSHHFPTRSLRSFSSRCSRSSSPRDGRCSGQHWRWRA